MKKNIMKIALMALLIVPLGLGLATSVKAAPLPNWNATGNYVVNLNYQSVNYPHDMSLTQNGLGNLTGSGGNPSGGPHVYTWVLTSGSVSGNTIDFMANYTAAADAVTPLTTMHVIGTIGAGGTMSGTWSDNYQGGTRTGTWTTTSGAATAITSASVTTNPATAITTTNATLNVTNGSSAAGGHSFWVSLSTFSTASSTIPAGVYSTPDLGAIAANAPFSASLSSLTTTGVPANLPAIMPNTTYYYAAWSNVGGTWYPGQVLTFTTDNSTVGGKDNEGIENDKNENDNSKNESNHEGAVLGGENNKSDSSGDHAKTTPLVNNLTNNNQENSNHGNHNQKNSD